MDKEKMQKQMEGLKEKIYFELQNNTNEVIIFGNDTISTACGELPLIMFKLASIITQLSQQSDLSEKKILKGIKGMIELYKKESNHYE